MTERQELRDDSWSSLLLELCEGRQAVEVAFWDGSGPGAARPARLREVSGSMLIIEHPLAGERPAEVTAGQDAEVSCGLDVGLLRFATWARGPWRTDEDPPLLALAVPERAEVLQRRGAYRVNLLETSVTLRSAGARGISGTVLNISSIGAAVSVEVHAGAGLPAGSAVGVNLAGVGDLPPLDLEGRVVRAAAGGPYRVLVGIAWLMQGRGERVVRDHLARLAAVRQRPVLRRRTGRA